MVAILCNNSCLFLMLGNTECFVRPYNFDGDRQSDILEIKYNLMLTFSDNLLYKLDKIRFFFKLRKTILIYKDNTNSSMIIISSLSNPQKIQSRGAICKIGQILQQKFIFNKLSPLCFKFSRFLFETVLAKFDQYLRSSSCSCSQFHQHFTSSFCANFPFCQKNTNLSCKFKKAARKTFI